MDAYTSNRLKKEDMKKIFQVLVSSEKEYVAADNYLDAIRCYMSLTDCNIEDISSIDEIPDDKLDTFRVNYENTDYPIKQLTFREYLEKANGNITEVFCSTIWD